ncbi:MAG: HPr family phosphocarrier protein [Firmicutes bacterium]|nr:HPr family phosphocarrier protein [Bacillota bacterium]
MKKSIQVCLQQAQHVKEFVNIVSKYPFEVDLKSGRFVIDAKSLLGIFSLDLSKPITLDIYSDKCDELLSELKPYTIG